LAETLERAVELGEQRQTERRLARFRGEIRRGLKHAPSAEREDARAVRRRNRPREELPVDEVVKIEPLIKRRMAAKAAGRSVRELREEGLTQDSITQASQLGRNRVQEAEKLIEAQWDLLESHPDFPAKRGSVIWPKPDEAAGLVASRRPADTAEK
jgi:hypothetical protein